MESGECSTAGGGSEEMEEKEDEKPWRKRRAGLRSRARVRAPEVSLVTAEEERYAIF